jgi:hypothetical protein
MLGEAVKSKPSMTEQEKDALAKKAKCRPKRPFWQGRKLQAHGPLAEAKKLAVSTDEQVRRFCEEVNQGGKRWNNFVLPQTNRDKSTTENSIVIKYGSCWQIKCVYYTKEEIKDKLRAFLQQKAELDKENDEGRLEGGRKREYMHMRNWMAKLRSPDGAEGAAGGGAAGGAVGGAAGAGAGGVGWGGARPSGADDESASSSDDDSDSELDYIARQRNAQSSAQPTTADEVAIHDFYNDFLGKTQIEFGCGESELDDRVYVKHKLDSALNGDQRVILKECVLYAPCSLIPEGAVLIDTAGTDDEDETKQFLLQQELENADTVLCVLEKNLKTEGNIVLWLKNERLIERALGTQEVLAPSEKPVKLVFMVLHEEKQTTMNARQIAADDLLSASQSAAAAETKAKIFELMETAYKSSTGSSAPAALIASALKNVDIFSCNPLLYASLLANRSLTYHPEQREVYQAALSRSNGWRLLQVLDKCATYDDTDDRVSELLQFLEKHDISEEIGKLLRHLMPSDIRARFKGALKQGQIMNATEQMKKRLEETQKELKAKSEDEIISWMQDTLAEMKKAMIAIVKAVETKIVAIPGADVHDGSSSKFGDLKHYFSGKGRQSYFSGPGEGGGRRLRGRKVGDGYALNKMVKDSLCKCLDIDRFSALAESCREQLQAKAIDALANQVSDRISAVVAVAGGDASASTSSDGGGAAGGDWQLRIKSLVMERRNTDWKESVFQKVKYLERRVDKKKMKKLLNDTVDAKIESCLFKDIVEVRNTAQLRQRFKANAGSFVDEVHKKMEHTLVRQWDADLQAAFQKLADTKPRALLRKTYGDFMKGVSKSLNVNEYEQIGEGLQVSVCVWVCVCVCGGVCVCVCCEFRCVPSSGLNQCGSCSCARLSTRIFRFTIDRRQLKMRRSG